MHRVTEGVPGASLEISGSPRAVPADVGFTPKRLMPLKHEPVNGLDPILHRCAVTADLEIVVTPQTTQQCQPLTRTDPRGAQGVTILNVQRGVRDGLTNVTLPERVATPECLVKGIAVRLAQKDPAAGTAPTIEGRRNRPYRRRRGQKLAPRISESKQPLTSARRPSGYTSRRWSDCRRSGPESKPSPLPSGRHRRAGASLRPARRPPPAARRPACPGPARPSPARYGPDRPRRAADPLPDRKHLARRHHLATDLHRIWARFVVLGARSAPDRRSGTEKVKLHLETVNPAVMPTNRLRVNC